MEHFDAIVIGTGGVGSAALYQLASRGVKVLGLDQFPQAHANGSSHGQTRIIRQAYFEHADYVPLLLRAYELWADVEKASDRKLFQQVGLFEVGPPDGVLIPGVMQSVSQHGIPVRELSGEAAQTNFPFVVPNGMQCVFEPTAGYLLVEECVQTHLELAAESGASWRQERMVDWTANAHSVSVTTEAASYEADRLVVCSGAWSSGILRELGVPLRIVTKQQYWFEPKPGDEDAAANALATFFFELPSGYFYGFPAVDGRGLKVARHSGGGEVDEPVSLEGQSDDEDLDAVEEFVRNHHRLCSTKLKSQQACMYTFSPDEHFIVDRHPESDRVVFAAGLSGHGFKFTTVLGELLADMAMGRQPSETANFLRLSRF